MKYQTCAPLCEPKLDLVYDFLGRPYLAPVQCDIDAAFQELLNTHLHKYQAEFKGKLLQHTVTIEQQNPVSDVLQEGAYMVITTIVQ